MDDVWYRLEEYLQIFPLYVNERPAISGYGITLGVTSGLSQKTTIHDATLLYHITMKALLQCLKDAGVVPRDFMFSTLQILFCADVARHRDSNAEDSESIIVSLGDFTGGDLNVAGNAISTRHAPLRFKGNVDHWVEPFEGTRWSLALYLNKDFDKLPDDALVQLTDLGFQLPLRQPPPDIGQQASGQAPPVRCQARLVIFEWAAVGFSIACALREREKVAAHYIFESDPDATSCIAAVSPTTGLVANIDWIHTNWFNNLMKEYRKENGAHFLRRLGGRRHSTTSRSLVQQWQKRQTLLLYQCQLWQSRMRRLQLSTPSFTRL